MIYINKHPREWEEGLTVGEAVARAIQKGGIIEPGTSKFYIINGRFVEEREAEKTVLKDEDVLTVLPTLSGG